MSAGRQDLIHGREGERCGARRAKFEDVDVGGRWDLEQNSGQLHLAVEFSGDRSGDFDFSVEEIIEVFRSCLRHLDIDVASIHEEIEVEVFQSAGGERVHAANKGVHRDPLAVELGVNELLEGSGNRGRQDVVAYDSDIVGLDLRPKARLGVPNDQNAIAGGYFCGGAGFDVDGSLAILDEEVHVSFSVIGDGGLEGDGKGEARLFVREGMNCREGTQRASLRPAEDRP